MVIFDRVSPSRLPVHVSLALKSDLSHRPSACAAGDACAARLAFSLSAIALIGGRFVSLRCGMRLAVARSARRQIAFDATLLQRRQLTSVATPASPETSRGLAPKVGLDIVEERRQPALSAAVITSRCATGIGRDLAVEPCTNTKSRSG